MRSTERYQWDCVRTMRTGLSLNGPCSLMVHFRLCPTPVGWLALVLLVSTRSRIPWNKNAYHEGCFAFRVRLRPWRNDPHILSRGGGAGHASWTWACGFASTTGDCVPGLVPQTRYGIFGNLRYRGLTKNPLRTTIILTEAVLCLKTPRRVGHMA